MPRGVPTARSREEAARWVRERARKHAKDTGQNPDKAEREVGKALRKGDRKESETGSR